MTSLRKTAPARPATIAASTHGYAAASVRLRRAAPPTTTGRSGGAVVIWH